MSIPTVLEKILEREQPDAILPTVGGQTALNLQVAQLVVDEGGCVHASAAYGSDHGISGKKPTRHAAKPPRP